ncbi:MAG: type II toxin-antitoxin system HicA family toxin [Phascolarctobacterium sp.]
MVTMKDKDLLRLLLKDGWILEGVKGSHHRLRKGEKIEVIPVHGKDMKIGLLKAIMKRTGLIWK